MQIENRKGLIVAIVSLSLLLALAVMAIQRAQIEARKMTSANTLKQIGLGLHNFEGAFRRLPAGCDLDAKHGWMTRIEPYMEANSWYSSIYMDYAWDHPSNAYKFSIRMWHWERPNVEVLFTEEGFGLAHYLANPSALHRDSKVRFSEIDAGLSNTWFAGEVSGKYQPFGYPFNWRPLTWPLNDQHGGYGGWSDGAQFCMGDAAIRFISTRMDKSVVEQLSKSTPWPDIHAVEAPVREFQSTNKPPYFKRLSFLNQEDHDKHRSKGESQSEIVFDSKGMPQIAVIAFSSGQAIKVGITIETILEKYPGIKVLDYGKVLEDNGAETIAEFHDLETLIVGQVALTATGIRKIETLSRLKSLSCRKGNEEAEAMLKAALPKCDISIRR